MFRAVLPIVKKGSKALGEELLKSSANAVGDIWKTGDLAVAKKRRGKEFVTNISNRVSDHMFGSGYTNLLGIRRKQLKPSAKRKKVVKRKAVKRKPKKKKVVKKKKKTVKKKKVRRTKQNIQDIFS